MLQPLQLSYVYKPFLIFVYFAFILAAKILKKSEKNNLFVYILYKMADFTFFFVPLHSKENESDFP